MIRALALAVALIATPAVAVQPDEMLDDPVLEARARALSRDLRCLVCRNESIDDSNAALARDLRLLVRERLVAGDSDAEVIRYIVSGDKDFAGYGEYVLLRPTARGSNVVLWVAGPAMLILSLGIVAVYLRRRRTATDTASAALSAEEARRLAEILKQ